MELERGRVREEQDLKSTVISCERTSSRLESILESSSLFNVVYAFDFANSSSNSSSPSFSSSLSSASSDMVTFLSIAPDDVACSWGSSSRFIKVSLGVISSRKPLRAFSSSSGEGETGFRRKTEKERGFSVGEARVGLVGGGDATESASSSPSSVLSKRLYLLTLVLLLSSVGDGAEPELNSVTDCDNFSEPLASVPLGELDLPSCLPPESVRLGHDWNLGEAETLLGDELPLELDARAERAVDGSGGTGGRVSFDNRGTSCFRTFLDPVVLLNGRKEAVDSN